MDDYAHAFSNQIDEHEAVSADRFQNNLDNFLDTGISSPVKQKKQFRNRTTARGQKPTKKAIHKKVQKLKSDLKKLQAQAVKVESEIQKARNELEKTQNNL
ncbi:MAG: hypothetical protein AABZ55_04815 [Bdellovibrionota bacterium]